MFLFARRFMGQYLLATCAVSLGPLRLNLSVPRLAELSHDHSGIGFYSAPPGLHKNEGRNPRCTKDFIARAYTWSPKAEPDSIPKEIHETERLPCKEYGSRRLRRIAVRIRYRRNFRHHRRADATILAFALVVGGHGLDRFVGYGGGIAFRWNSRRPHWPPRQPSHHGDSLSGLRPGLRRSLELGLPDRLPLHRRPKHRRLLRSGTNVHRRNCSRPMARPPGGIFSVQRRVRNSCRVSFQLHRFA